MRIGGTEQVIKNLIEGADSTQFDMSVFCIETPLGPWGEELKKSGISIEAINRNPGFDTKLITAIRRYIKEHKIDILHCHQYTPYVYGVIAAIFTSTKVIFTEHGRFYPDRSSWKRKIINPILSQFTASITAISKATKQALITYEFFNSDKIEVVYNGIIDLSQRTFDTKGTQQELNIAEDEIIFGTISRLDPIKNHIMMLSAFSQLVQTHPKCKLLIVGDGEMRSQLEQLTNELNIGDNVVYTGYKASPQKYLDVIDVFLLTSFSEGTSMTLLEAMSFSKPSIVTDVGGNPEIVIDNETGLIIPNDNSESLVTKMKLLLDQKLRNTYGENAKARFEAQFSLKNMSKRYSSIYKKCLPGN